MTPVPPNVVLSALGKTGGALQKQQQLAGFRDQLLIDAIATASADAELAAKAIVDEAEAILSDATVCRWDDADDVHALRVRITHYLEDRPRLTSLTDALDQLPTLLEELHRRAKRKLQTPAKKTKKQAPLAAAIDALASLRDFVEELPAETMHLPAGTGVAAEEQVFLLDLTQQEAPETHQPCRSGRGRDCIGQGGGEAVADTTRFQRRPAGVGRRPHRLRLIAGFKPRLPIGARPATRATYEGTLAVTDEQLRSAPPRAECPFARKGAAPSWCSSRSERLLRFVVAVG